MPQNAPLSAYAKRVAATLSHIQLAIDAEHAILNARAQFQPWKALRSQTDEAWDDVLTELSELSAAENLSRDETRLAVLCDRIARYLMGDDIDPTLWQLVCAGPMRNKSPFERLMRRGVSLTNAYATLLEIDAFAA